jgi:aminopeptidase N
VTRKIFLKDYLEPPFQIPQVDLKFHLDFNETRLTSKITTIGIKEDKAFHLNIGNELQIHSVKDIRSNQLLKYEIEGSQMEIISVAKNPILEFEITLFPSKNKALEGIYKAGNLILSQCEAEGFREISPFLDRPDVLSVYSVEIIADINFFPVLLSNGNLLSSSLKENTRIVKWEDPFPKPCYLFALAAGNLEKISDYYQTTSKRNILIEIYSEKESLEKLYFAMNALKTAMRWDEDEYGREYDLDRYMIVATPHFNMGAMENKGLNIFNTSCLFAHEDYSTDNDFERVEAVVAHEYFHNWSGNRVTLRDWFQLSLKEGFTVFREQEFMRTRISPEVQRLNDVHTLKQFQFAEDSSSFSHSVRPDSYLEINNFYTYTVYEKGAEIIRMIQLIMGDIAFKKGAIHFFESMDGKACTVEDFIGCFQAYTSYNLDKILVWYNQAGTPELRIESNFTGNSLELKFEQRNRYSEPLVLPILFKLTENKTGKNIEVNVKEVLSKDNGNLFILEESEARITLDLNEKPILSALLNFSAPVKLKVNSDMDDLEKILQSETDACILQQTIAEIFLREINELENGSESLSELFLRCFRTIIANTYSMPALYAVILELPRPDLSSEQSSKIDPVSKALYIDKLVSLIGRQFENEFQHLLNYSESYIFTPIHNLEGRAWRKLHHTLSFYIYTASPSSSHWLDNLKSFIKNKAHMQLQITALNVFCHNKSKGWESLLKDFEYNYESQDLLIDKLFSVYATIPSIEEGFSTVQSIEAKYPFEHDKPNRIRSLYGMFSNHNTLGFHGNHNKSYQWFLNKLKDIDLDNPQLSARLFQPFTKLPHFKKKYQESFLSASETLMNSRISSNLKEQIDKLLMELF